VRIVAEGNSEDTAGSGASAQRAKGAFEGTVQNAGKQGIQLGGDLALGGDRMHRIDRMMD